LDIAVYVHKGSELMSLDISLTLENISTSAGSGIFIRENGQNKEISRSEWDEKFPNRVPVVAASDNGGEVYEANITHNLTKMASEAGLYECIWRPEECYINTAYQLIAPLESRLRILESNSEYFEQFNPDNGWGNYKGFVEFVKEYLAACKRYPDATVRVWR